MCIKSIIIKFIVWRRLRRQMTEEFLICWANKQQKENDISYLITW